MDINTCCTPPPPTLSPILLPLFYLFFFPFPHSSHLHYSISLFLLLFFAPSLSPLPPPSPPLITAVSKASWKMDAEFSKAWNISPHYAMHTPTHYCAKHTQYTLTQTQKHSGGKIHINEDTHTHNKTHTPGSEWMLLLNMFLDGLQ